MDGHLGHFHLLALANNAAGNMGAQRSVYVPVLLLGGISTGMEFLNHRVILGLTLNNLVVLFYMKQNWGQGCLERLSDLFITCKYPGEELEFQPGSV